jgi:hypothetical protein
MPHIVPDTRIAEWLSDPKPISFKDVQKLKTGLKPERNRTDQIACRIDIIGKSRRRYGIIATRPSDPARNNSFSIVLTTVWYGKSFNLIRHNGWHREHSNDYEKSTKQGVQGIAKNTFHIHRATERYQRYVPLKAVESYAEPTTEFSSFAGAVELLCSSYGFYLVGYEYKTLNPLFD